MVTENRPPMYPLIFMDIDSEIPSESRSVVITLCMFQIIQSPLSESKLVPLRPAVVAVGRRPRGQPRRLHLASCERAARWREGVRLFSSIF